MFVCFATVFTLVFTGFQGYRVFLCIKRPPGIEYKHARTTIWHDHCLHVGRCCKRDRNAKTETGKSEKKAPVLRNQNDYINIWKPRSPSIQCCGELWDLCVPTLKFGGRGWAIAFRIHTCAAWTCCLSDCCWCPHSAGASFSLLPVSWFTSCVVKTACGATDIRTRAHVWAETKSYARQMQHEQRHTYTDMNSKLNTNWHECFIYRNAR